MSLEAINRFEVPAALLAETLDRLREYGAMQKERFVFWAGTLGRTSASISVIEVPRQLSYNQQGMCWVDIPADEVRRMMIGLSMRDLTLVAQVHTHPRQAFHSDRDDVKSVLRLPGSLSIVIPDFATVPFSSMSRYACYRRAPGGRWGLVPAAEVDQLVVVR